MTSLRGPAGRQLQEVHPDLRVRQQPQALSPPHVYWSDVPTATIGEANLDGSGVNQSFITGANTDLPYGVAIDGQHIYWSNSAANTIGRANLDGTGVNQTFIPGADAPHGVAVDSQHVYWTSYGENAIGAIGAANLEGTDVNPTFITGLSSPYGLAVYGQRIYWTSLTGGTIGTANLDGTGVNPTFITGLAHPNGVAVDAQPSPASQQIYWSDFDVGIGVASLDGLGVIQDYFLVDGAVHDVAVDQGVVYFTWEKGNGGGIGTDRDANFVTGLGFPLGIAVTYVPPVPPDPCGILAEELADLSRSDFPNQAAYLRVESELREQLQACRKAHGEAP